MSTTWIKICTCSVVSKFTDSKLLFPIDVSHTLHWNLILKLWQRKVAAFTFALYSECCQCLWMINIWLPVKTDSWHVIFLVTCHTFSGLCVMTQHCCVIIFYKVWMTQYLAMKLEKNISQNPFCWSV